LATQLGLPIVDCNTWVGFYPRQAIDMSAQTLLTLMRRYGVARALFVHTTAVFYDARIGNDLAVKVAHESGGTLLPVATLNPLQFRGITEEVERRLQQGFRLFRFFPSLQGWTPFIAPFRDLLQFLSERKVPSSLIARRWDGRRVWRTWHNPCRFPSFSPMSPRKT